MHRRFRWGVLNDALVARANAGVEGNGVILTGGKVRHAGLN